MLSLNMMRLTFMAMAVAVLELPSITDCTHTHTHASAHTQTHAHLTVTALCCTCCSDRSSWSEACSGCAVLSPRRRFYTAAPPRLCADPHPGRRALPDAVPGAAERAEHAPSLPVELRVEMTELLSPVSLMQARGQRGRRSPILPC